MKPKYDILILVDAGIGNALQALYAVELAMDNNTRVGLFMGRVSASFQDYVEACYGADVVLRDLKDVQCRDLIHSFLYQSETFPGYEKYHYLSAESTHAVKHRSESQMYVDLVSSILGVTTAGELKLNRLKAEGTDRLRNLNVEGKVVIYPGGSSHVPARRWPHFRELCRQLNEGEYIIIGGEDDTRFDYSYMYPGWIAWLPQFILKRQGFFRFAKGLGLLKKYAHWPDLRDHPNSYIQTFDWAELVWLLQHCRFFVGNDGGLSHLAGSSGANGVVLFGPTSLEKNKPYALSMEGVTSNQNCSPCQFGVGGVFLSQHMISCPYGMKCMQEITVDHVLQRIRNAD